MTTLTDTRSQLWAAALTKLEQLNAHRNRSAADWTNDGLACRVTGKVKNDDGTWTVHELEARLTDSGIETTVDTSTDQADWFWQPIFDEADRRERVVVDDRCYTVRPDSAQSGSHDGFGGRRFVIEWLDDAGEPTGEIFTTRNLWARGTVPPSWRGRLKPNARFVDQSGAR